MFLKIARLFCFQRLLLAGRKNGKNYFFESFFFSSIKLWASRKFNFLMFELAEWEKVCFQYFFYLHFSSEDYSEQLK